MAITRKSVMLTAMAAACALVSVAAVAGMSAHAQGQTTILTGQWNYATKLGFIPVGNDTHCLTQKDVDNFNRGICLKHYRCDYDTAEVRDGRVNLKGTWTEKNGHVIPVTAQGAYTPESFQVTVHGQGMSASINANRTSATCSAA